MTGARSNENSIPALVGKSEEIPPLRERREDMPLLVEEIQLGPSRRSGVYPAQRNCLPFKEAKERIVDQWENGYLRGLLDSAAGNLTLAAENAGMARGHLYRLMRKHGLSR